MSVLMSMSPCHASVSTDPLDGPTPGRGAERGAGWIRGQRCCQRRCKGLQLSRWSESPIMEVNYSELEVPRRPMENGDSSCFFGVRSLPPQSIDA